MIAHVEAEAVRAARARMPSLRKALARCQCPDDGFELGMLVGERVGERAAGFGRAVADDRRLVTALVGRASRTRRVKDCHEDALGGGRALEALDPCVQPHVACDIVRDQRRCRGQVGVRTVKTDERHGIRAIEC